MAKNTKTKTVLTPVKEVVEVVTPVETVVEQVIEEVIPVEVVPEVEQPIEVVTPVEEKLEEFEKMNVDLDLKIDELLNENQQLKLEINHLKNIVEPKICKFLKGDLVIDNTNNTKKQFYIIEKYAIHVSGSIIYKLVSRYDDELLYCLEENLSKIK